MGKTSFLLLALLLTSNVTVAHANEEALCALKSVDMNYGILLGGVGYRLTCESQESQYFKKAFCYSGQCRKDFLSEINKKLEAQGLYFFLKADYFDVYSRERYTENEKAATRLLKREVYVPQKGQTSEKVTFYKTSCFGNRCSETIQLSKNNVDLNDIRTVEQLAEQQKCKITSVYKESQENRFYSSYFFCQL